MTPLGFSGGSHDRLSVSAVERIRWTVGTADGAAGRTTERTEIRFHVRAGGGGGDWLQRDSQIITIQNTPSGNLGTVHLLCSALY